MILVVYVITFDPKKNFELASSIFAQALTALAFGYKVELFCMGEGALLAKKGHVDGLKYDTFQPLTEMLDDFIAMDGLLYACHPSTDARTLKAENCVEGVKFVNASHLLGSAKEAMTVFTY